MTEISRAPGAMRRSPHALRNTSFSQRRRGFDQDEVRDFLEGLANQVESSDAERSNLRAEIDRLTGEIERIRSSRDNTNAGTTTGRPEINSQAVAMFSQAQQVADRLVSEAVQHARELMVNARAQQREILQQAHDAAEAAARQTGSFDHANPAAGYSHGHTQGYDAPVPEIEYVRTFARVAQVQLRSVLDALTEQVDRLGDVPKLNDGQGHATGPVRDAPPDATVQWQLEAAPPAPRYRSAAQY